MTAVPASLADAVDAGIDLSAVEHLDRYAGLIAAAWSTMPDDLRVELVDLMQHRLDQVAAGLPVDDVDGTLVVVDPATPDGAYFVRHHQWIVDGCSDQALAARFLAAAS